MLADFFTKPLNGSLFRKFRDVILGYKHVSSLQETMPHDVEERVGIKQLQGRHNVSQNAVTKINSNVSTPVPIYTKSMVQENLTAARMDSRDSLNRLNPVDDNK
jgi:hypothetical protein